MATLNRQIVLAARPEGLPKPSDFRLVETPVPELAEGQFLVKIDYLPWTRTCGAGSARPRATPSRSRSAR